MFREIEPTFMGQPEKHQYENDHFPLSNFLVIALPGHIDHPGNSPAYRVEKTYRAFSCLRSDLRSRSASRTSTLASSTELISGSDAMSFS